MRREVPVNVGSNSRAVKFQLSLWVLTGYHSCVVKFDNIRHRPMYMLRGKNNNSSSCDLQEEIHVANFNELLMISSVPYFCSSNKIASFLQIVGGGLSVPLQQAGINSCSTNFS
jgi:hypothetical protein